MRRPAHHPAAAVACPVGLLDGDGGAVGQDLGGTLGDHRRREAHVDDGVCALPGGVLLEALEGLGAGLLHHLGVAAELAADHALEAGADVLEDDLGADRAAAGQAVDLGNGESLDVGGGDDNHECATPV